LSERAEAGIVCVNDRENGGACQEWIEKQANTQKDK